MYDQQSAEAASMTEAALSAYRETNNLFYKNNRDGQSSTGFLGMNTKSASVYNSTTGGCYDGITEKGLNLNMGAEATVCYLSARMELETTNRTRTPQIRIVLAFRSESFCFALL